MPRRMNSRTASLAQRNLTGKIHADHDIPLGQRHLIECRILLQAGIVNENVDRSEFLDHLSEHLLYLLFLRNIGLKRKGPATRSGYSVDYGLRHIISAHIVHHHVRACFPQRNRDGFTDAGICAGHEGFFVPLTALVPAAWAMRVSVASILQSYGSPISSSVPWVVP